MISCTAIDFPSSNILFYLCTRFCRGLGIYKFESPTKIATLLFGKANSEIALFQSEVDDCIWEVSFLCCNKNGHHYFKLPCVLVDMGVSRDPSLHQIKQFCYFRTCQVIVATTELFVPVVFAKKGWSQILVLMRGLNTHPQEVI